MGGERVTDITNAPYQDSLESNIYGLGNELYRLSQHHLPIMFTKSWVHDKVLSYCLRNESFKLRLFQFIDVLPSLHTPVQLLKILREYFSDESIAKSIRVAINLLPHSQISAELVSRLVLRQAQSFARQFMVADTISKSLRPLNKLWDQGRAFSVDLLGEEAVSEREADQYCQHYIDALTILDRSLRTWKPQPIIENDQHGILPRTNISVKLSSLYSQLNPISPEGSFCGVAPRLRAILRTAQAISAAITIDMETHQLKDLVLDIIQQIFSEDEFLSYPYAGVAIQAYLKNSEQDVKDLISWTSHRGQPFHIRLVKGAYWDYEQIIAAQRGWPTPVFEQKSDTDANFEKMTNLLLDHTNLLRPAIGSHNLRSIAHAVISAQQRGISKHSYEIQMLYGIANPLKDALHHINVRLREYTPIGDLLHGMAYLIRRLLENTSNESVLPSQLGSLEKLDKILLNPTSINKQHKPHSPLNSPEITDFYNEPLTDFSKPYARMALQNALNSAKDDLKKLNTLNQERYMVSSKKSLTSHNPANSSEVIGRICMVTQHDVDTSINRAKTSQNKWAMTNPKARAEILFQSAEELRKRRFEFAAWEILEVGRSWMEADADVTEAIDFLEFYGREMFRIGNLSRLGNYPGELNIYQYRARGLVAVLSPWNFPLAIPTGMIASALVTGNGVLFKPSERSLMLSAKLAEVFWANGIPENILQFLPGGPDIGQYLVEHSNIHVISFTGSKQVGLQIIETAAKHQRAQRNVKKVVAEMGGKNAIIVDDTADMDEAIRGIVKSSFGFQGQKCSACSRLILLSTIYESLVSRLVEATKSLSIGPPENPRHQIGPVIDRRALDTITEYIDHGKQVAVQALQCNAWESVPNDGCYVPPQIFLNVSPGSRLAQEEIFGPVLSVLVASNFEEALQIANDTEYGLTAGLFSRSPRNIARAKETIEVGNLYINRGIVGALVGCQPFGGFHLSGCGAKAGGPDYLKQFMVAQAVTEQTLRRGFAPLSKKISQG
tara:strand:- start:4824 stop:7847 length:3024 start_codon:yes stop_codon:yes gene_type:complete